MTVPCLLPPPCSWSGRFGECVAVVVENTRLNGGGNIRLEGWGCPVCHRVLIFDGSRASIDTGPDDRVACQKETP